MHGSGRPQQSRALTDPEHPEIEFEFGYCDARKTRDPEAKPSSKGKNQQ
jgi:hypothetical protein